MCRYLSCDVLYYWHFELAFFSTLGLVSVDLYRGGTPTERREDGVFRNLFVFYGQGRSVTLFCEPRTGGRLAAPACRRGWHEIILPKCFCCLEDKFLSSFPNT